MVWKKFIPPDSLLNKLYDGAPKPPRRSRTNFPDIAGDGDERSNTGFVVILRGTRKFVHPNLKFHAPPANVRHQGDTASNGLPVGSEPIPPHPAGRSIKIQVRSKTRVECGSHMRRDRHGRPVRRQDVMWRNIGDAGTQPMPAPTAGSGEIPVPCGLFASALFQSGNAKIFATSLPSRNNDLLIRRLVNSWKSPVNSGCRAGRRPIA